MSIIEEVRQDTVIDIPQNSLDRDTSFLQGNLRGRGVDQIHGPLYGFVTEYLHEVGKGVGSWGMKGCLIGVALYGLSNYSPEVAIGGGLLAGALVGFTTKHTTFLVSKFRNWLYSNS